MPNELDSPVVVDFPLRGEGWLAVTTPAARIPSHGVDALGQRYAYDFLVVDERPGEYFFPGSGLGGALRGVRTRDCYAWGAPIHAPFDGEVVAALDGMPERQWIHPVREVVRQVVNGAMFAPSRLDVHPRQSRGSALGRPLRGSRASRTRHPRRRRRSVGALRRRARRGRPHRQLDQSASALPAHGRGGSARRTGCALCVPLVRGAARRCVVGGDGRHSGPTRAPALRRGTARAPG